MRKTTIHCMSRPKTTGLIMCVICRRVLPEANWIQVTTAHGELVLWCSQVSVLRSCLVSVLTAIQYWQAAIWPSRAYGNVTAAMAPSEERTDTCQYAERKRSQ